MSNEIKKAGLLFFNRNGKPINTEDIFRPVDNPKHQAILAKTGAGMAFWDSDQTGSKPTKQQTIIES